MDIEPIYPYRTLLDAVCQHENTLSLNRDINVLAPDVRVAGRKSNFINFVKVCSCLDRECDHLKQYLDSELSTSSSVNIDGVLIITGKFRSADIQNILLKYIISYVQCASCQSIKTKLDKENKLKVMSCINCNSTKYVN